MGVEHVIYMIKIGIILYCKVVNHWKEGEVEKTEGDSSHQHYSINPEGSLPQVKIQSNNS